MPDAGTRRGRAGCPGSPAIALPERHPVLLLPLQEFSPDLKPPVGQSLRLLLHGPSTWLRTLDRALVPTRLIPHCQLHVFPHCDHWAMIECKEDFETLVLGFLGHRS